MSALALLLLLPCAQPKAATASVTPAWIDDVVAGRDVLPSLEAVQQAAVEALALPEAETVRGWSSRARWRGALPRLDVTAGSDADLDVRDSFSSSASRTTTEGRAFGLRASAQWALGDLVFADSELRAHREAIARAAAVQLARERVTQLYFERVEVLAAARAADPPELRIRAALLDGLIRAMTGGRWPLGGRR